MTIAVSVSATRSAHDDAFALSRKTAGEISARIGDQLDNAMGTARTLSGALGEWARSGKPDRAAADAMLRGALDAVPDSIGIWTVWEPGAFDGRDAEFVNKPGHDATGRYVPYWNRASGHTQVEANKDYTVEGAGDYYLLPKRSNQETVTEPYLYKVGGKEVLMTSLVVPVRRKDGTFVGAVGIDLPLATLASGDRARKNR